MKYYLKPLHMAPVCSHNPVAWNLSWSPHYERKIKLHLHEVDLREFCRYAKTPHESCKQWPHDVYLKWPTGCLLHCNYQNKFTTWDLWNIFLKLLVIQASYSFPFFPVNLIFWNCWVFLSFSRILFTLFSLSMYLHFFAAQEWSSIQDVTEKSCWEVCKRATCNNPRSFLQLIFVENFFVFEWDYRT